MLNRVDSTAALRAHFHRHSAATLEDLRRILRTPSRMSVFRRLRELGYLSSYTHNGRYYTLAGVPDFDENGLWFHRGIGFSQVGTLKETAAQLVEGSSAGHTHLELESLVRTRMQNTLFELFRGGRLWRERLGRPYLYLSIEVVRRERQLDQRRALMAVSTEEAVSIPVEVIIDVLVETLHASKGLAPASVVAARLAARGRGATVAQVEAIFAEHGLEPGKKTVEPG